MEELGDHVDVEDEPIPDNLQMIIDSIGFISSEQSDDDLKELFKQSEEGKCMCCKGPLGPRTSIVLTTQGIVMIFCCGQCHTDMAVLGWLQEQHDDVMSAVKFRG
jgi:hypothetical protein